MPVVRNGRRVYQGPSIEETRAFALSSVGELDETITRFLNPHTYPVGLEQRLNELRTTLVLAARGLGA